MTETAEAVDVAVRYHRAGCLRQAKAMYELVLQRDHNHPLALHSLGAIAYQEGRYDQAVDFISKAIAADQRIPEFHNSIGVVFKALGRLEEAISAYEQAVLIKPDYAEAYCNMAVTLQAQGSLDAAIEMCRQALLLRPTYAEAHNHLGTILDDQGRYTEAIENYTQALRLKPDYTEAHNNLGIALRTQGRLAEAIAHCDRAIQLKPHSAEPYYNLACAQRDLGQCEQAVANYDRAIQLRPNCAQAHWNRALALLLSGNLIQGWKAYQWRRNPDLKIVTYPHRYEVPRWEGSSFRGKTLLVHYEQGLGDTLQFIRYMPMVRGRGGRVILEVRKPLVGLFRGFLGVECLVQASHKKPAVQFDFHVSLMDLPRIFGTTLETIPSKVPYLHAASDKTEYWKDKFADTGLSVGIVWAGSPVHAKDHIRSCPLEYFVPLARIRGVRLYGLQKGPAAKQVEGLAGRVAIVNLAEEFEDFTDTAAAIANLDLIISVDTAVLHLAGAMGKPVWALLPVTPDWRWMLNRQDSPWYPTMRLFRQNKQGDWSTVLCTVAHQLKTQVARFRTRIAARTTKARQ